MAVVNTVTLGTAQFWVPYARHTNSSKLAFRYQRFLILTKDGWDYRTYILFCVLEYYLGGHILKLLSSSARRGGGEGWPPISRPFFPDYGNRGQNRPKWPLFRSILLLLVLLLGGRRPLPPSTFIVDTLVPDVVVVLSSGSHAVGKKPAVGNHTLQNRPKPPSPRDSNFKIKSWPPKDNL